MNNKLKVLEILPSFSAGGAERIVFQLTNGLYKRNNVNILLISLYSKEYSADIFKDIEKRIPVVYLNKRKGSDFHVFADLSKIIKQFSPDIIHTHLTACFYALPFIFAMKLLEKRRVIMYHTEHNTTQRALNPVIKISMFLAYKLFDNCKPIAVSELVRKTVAETYNIKAKKVNVIYNGIDVTLGKRIIRRDKEFRICSVGRLEKAKNHILLLKAVKCLVDKHPDVSFTVTILGDGLLRDELNDFCEKNGMGDIVVFKGIVQEVSECILNSDIFVSTSINEGFGLAIAEAMLLGCPVVVSKGENIYDIVTDKYDGLTFTSDNLTELIGCIEFCIYNENLCDALAQRAKKTALKYSLESMINSYEELFLNSF